MRNVEYITTKLEDEPGRAVVTFDFDQCTLSCIFIPDDRDQDYVEIFASTTNSKAEGSLRFKRVTEKIKKEGL